MFLMWKSLLIRRVTQKLSKMNSQNRISRSWTNIALQQSREHATQKTKKRLERMLRLKNFGARCATKENLRAKQDSQKTNENSWLHSISSPSNPFSFL